MVRDPKRAKTESLSLRLDPKTKFVLDFVARVRGQSITTVVERSIREAAEDVKIGPKHDFRGNDIEQRNWTDYWDASEAVRSLSLIADNNYPTTYDEDELLRFTLDHWPFFYVSADNRAPRRAFVDVLWPRMPEFVDLWRRTRSEDYWAVGKAMAEALGSANLKAPDWPLPAPKAAPKKVDDLDDEIPF